MRMISSHGVYRNAWLSVREDQVERDDESTGVYGVVDKPDFAVVIPQDADGLWFVEQSRYPVGRRAYEFPQGSWSHGAGGAAEQDMGYFAVTEQGFRDLVKAGDVVDGATLAAYSLLLLAQS